MRVVCPSCEAAYAVPETVLTARPMLRCARCASDFRPPELSRTPEPALQDNAEAQMLSEPAAPAERPAELTAPAEPAEPLAPPSPPPPPEPVLQPKVVSAERTRVLAAWAGSLVVIAAALWLGISHRSAVMRAWPPSIRLYALFGGQTK